jgi:hypothetical protein
VIEHSSQVFVFQSCFRLVRFSSQVAAQAAGPPVSHLARLIRSESSDRGDQFVSDRFSERSAKKSCHFGDQIAARGPMARSSIETNERFVMSRRSSSQRTGFRIKADVIAETLIFRA